MLVYGVLFLPLIYQAVHLEFGMGERAQPFPGSVIWVVVIVRGRVMHTVFPNTKKTIWLKNLLRSRVGGDPYNYMVPASGSRMFRSVRLFLFQKIRVLSQNSWFVTHIRLCNFETSRIEPVRKAFTFHGIWSNFEQYSTYNVACYLNAIIFLCIELIIKFSKECTICLV